MWGLDAKSIILAFLVAGGKALYNKVSKYIEKNQYVDRGIIPKWDQLELLDNKIPEFSQQYAEYTKVMFNEALTFARKLQGKKIDFKKVFGDYLMQKVIDEGAVIDESNVRFDEKNNIVWFLANPEDTIPFGERKVIFLNNTISDTDALTEKSIQGFLTQIMVSKILKETMVFGSLKGVIIVFSVSYGYHMPYHVCEHTKLYPDAIVICEPTGRKDIGPLGFAIAQKGKAKIAISFSGNEEKKKELKREIEKEVKQIPDSTVKDSFLGKGKIEVDSDDDSNIIIKRTLTFGETSNDAMKEVQHLPLIHDLPDNSMSFALTKIDDIGSWETPRETRAILAATEAYRRTLSPWAVETDDIDEIRMHPFFTQRENSDNYSGYPARIETPDGFEWCETGDGVTPPTFAMGAGFADRNDDDNNVSTDHMQAAVSVMARFPSLFAEEFD